MFAAFGRHISTVKRNIDSKCIQRKGVVARLISDKIDSGILKKVVRDKYRHFIMIKGMIYQKDNIFQYTYASNLGAPKHIKQLVTDLREKLAEYSYFRGTNYPIDRNR